jgi:phospholipase/carboxylesterase
MPGLAEAYQWWPIDTFSMAERAAGADAAAPGLDAFITQELKDAGLPSGRVLLIGFSQGAMMALHVGCVDRRRWRGSSESRACSSRRSGFRRTL